MATMQRMRRFRGHFFNWYDTADLRVLPPAYVSSVDSGNLAGHLLAVAQSCRDWQAPVPRDVLHAGLADALALAREDGEGPTELLARMQAARPDALEALIEVAMDGPSPGWLVALRGRLADHRADTGTDFAPRLQALETQAHRMALAMDFAFLLDPEKKLLSIGFSSETNSLDANCYDLLASEARLASLFAIAKGDVPTRHWFRLGRSATPVRAGAALISWSGSMFEYLMPSLVMRAPRGSLLEQTNRLIVTRQQDHGRALGIPWGVSESSFNARDLEMTYQYSNFGVPGLGLKRGLGADRVIAPYATGLAAMVDPAAAVRNFRALRALGAEGRHGFYEAVDFTTSRLPEGESAAVVRSFMAHHQGMTIAGIANIVQDGLLRRRFHADPLVQAVDLLLQERVPRDVNAAHPHAEEMPVAAAAPDAPPTVRRIDAPEVEAPTAHLLSNGRYGVMLTSTGAGFSQWRDMAVTRWRPDATRDALGTFLFASDVASGALWSAGVQPVPGPGRRSAVFSEHQAAFTHRQGTLPDHGRGRRLGRGRCRGAAGHTGQYRASAARDRSDLLCRAGAGARRRGSGPSRLLQALRGDRPSAGAWGHRCHPPPSLTGRARGLGSPHGRGGRDRERTCPDRDGPGALHRARPVAGRSGDGAGAAVRHHRHRAGSDLRNPTPCSGAGRRHGARDLLDHGCRERGEAARHGGPPPRSVGLRARDDAGLDQVAGAAAPSRRERRRGGRFPAARRVRPAQRRPAAPLAGADRGRGRAAVGPLAARHLGRPAHRAPCRSRISRTWTRWPSCSPRTNTGAPGSFRSIW